MKEVQVYTCANLKLSKVTNKGRFELSANSQGRFYNVTHNFLNLGTWPWLVGKDHT